jgi:hypothetical protein
MFRTHKRIAGGLAVLALALATATPAAARPFITDAQGSIVPAPTALVHPASSHATGSGALVHTVSRHASGGGFDWDYVAAGVGAASLVLIGAIGGTAVGRRQRRTRGSALAA